MKLKLVVVDIETPAWLKKTLRVAAPIAAIAVSGVVIATPKKWNTGDPLTAVDLNHLTVMTAKCVAYSIGATHYCGVGPVATNGQFSYNGKTSYAAGKAMCEASAGCGMSATAHMCSSEELSRSFALGDAVGLGWYTSFAEGPLSGGAVDDCVGWTGSDSADAGPASGLLSGLYPAHGACSSMFKVVCCD